MVVDVATWYSVRLRYFEQKGIAAKGVIDAYL
jgi:hypothetical protein